MHDVTVIDDPAAAEASLDPIRARLLAELAERLGVPCVATGNVHVHAFERIPLQDAMVAVRLGVTLDESEPRRRGNSSHVLAPPERMVERFREHPDAVAETGRLAERLRFDLSEDLGYRYPGSEDETADRRLAELCGSRMDERYGGRRIRAEAERRLEECAKLGLKTVVVPADTPPTRRKLEVLEAETLPKAITGGLG